MIALRSASSAAWSERARRIGIGLAARRSMPGIQPTVETAVRRFVMPRSGRRSQAPSTWSRFIIGSPLPLDTAWASPPGAPEGRRLVEALARREVAPELHRAGRAEGARQRAAGLRGQAEGAAPV